MWQKSSQPDPRYRSLRDSGKSVAEAVTELRQADVSPIECIKAIREYEQIDLGEAKRVYCGCPPYEKEREAHEHLIDQALVALEDAT